MLRPQLAVVGINRRSMLMSSDHAQRACLDKHVNTEQINGTISQKADYLQYIVLFTGK